MPGTITAIFRGCQLAWATFARKIALAKNRREAIANHMGMQPRIRVNQNALRTAIKRFMKDREIKPTPWALKAGVPESTFRSFLNGKANAPRHDTLEKLARAADVTIAEMIGEKLPPPRSMRDALPIQSLEVSASAGGGFQIEENPVGPPFFFRREWIESILTRNPGRLRVIWFRGDSMAPTINDGDLGLVHLDYGQSDPGIYTLWDGRGVVAKRLELLPGADSRLRVMSDNPKYPAYEVAADEAFVLGRVIWRGGGI